MKIGAISGDMAVKLALGAGALLVLVYVLNRARNTASDVADAVVTGITPWNPDNWANSAVSAIGGALVTDPAGPGKNADGTWSLGGWAFDVLHPNAWETDASKLPGDVTGNGTGDGSFLDVFNQANSYG